MKCGADMTAATPVEASSAGATGSGFGYTPQPTMGGDPAPGTQERYGAAGYVPDSNGYAAPPQFAPNPAGYGSGPTMGIADQGQLVGFWMRLGAYIIDAILLAIVIGILRAIHLGGLGSLVDIVYFVGFWSTTGQTLGMLALRIKVVREDGRPLTLATGILRYIGFVISVIVIFIGLLWVIWDPKKQGWHDKIAHTLVVRAR